MTRWGEVQLRLTHRTAQAARKRIAGAGDQQPGGRRTRGDHRPGSDLEPLARLERLGLTVNSGNGHAKGEANAWTLTALGSEVAQRVSTRVNLNTHYREVAS